MIKRLIRWLRQLWSGAPEKRPYVPPKPKWRSVVKSYEFDFDAKAGIPIAWDDDALDMARDMFLAKAEKALRKTTPNARGAPDIQSMVCPMGDKRARAEFWVTVPNG